MWIFEWLQHPNLQSGWNYNRSFVPIHPNLFLVTMLPPVQTKFQPNWNSSIFWIAYDLSNFKNDFQMFTLLSPSHPEPFSKTSIGCQTQQIEIQSTHLNSNCRQATNCFFTVSITLILHRTYLYWKFCCLSVIQILLDICILSDNLMAGELLMLQLLIFW